MKQPKYTTWFIYAIAAYILVMFPDYIWNEFVPDRILCLLCRWYHLINLESRFDYLTLAVLLLVCIYPVMLCLNDKDFKKTRIFNAALVSIALWQNPYEWAQLWNTIDIRILPQLASCIVAVSETNKYLSNRNVKPTDKKGGFETDCIKANINNTYVKVLVEKLLNTDISQHAFSISVVGEWGTGKTTFLHSIKEVIQPEAYVVDFNPWIYSDASQVMSDFFASVAKVVGKNHSSLRRPISEYLYSLGKELPSDSAKWLCAFYRFFYSEGGISEKKEKLSNQLLKLDKPIVVFIDDLDRLESAEIFEVLRLIRNTGDLKNIIYVSAYDKDYVESMLKDKGIHSPALYLEKIFDVEFHLPKSEEYLLEEELTNSMTASGFSKSFLEKMRAGLDRQDFTQVLNILGSYRQIKRFSRLYIMNFHSLNRLVETEYRGGDVLWLTLLQMYDRSIYDELYRDRYKLLYLDADRYILRSDIFKGSGTYPKSDIENHRYQGEEIWREKTPEILNHLFGKSRGTLFGIANVDHFDKYFCLALNPRRLTLKGFKEIYGPNKIVRIITQRWADEGLYYRSIWGKFKEGLVKSNSLEAFKIYLEAYCRIYAIYLIKSSSLSTFELRSIFNEKSYYQTELTELKEWVKSCFEIIIHERKVTPIQMMRALKSLYVTAEFYQEEPVKPERYLLDNNNIQELMSLLMRQYLRDNPEALVRDVFDPRNELGNLVKESTVCVNLERTSDEMDYYKNVVSDVLIQYFSGVEKTFTKDYLSSLYKDMFPIKEQTFEDPNEQQDYENSQYELSEMRYTSHFGSDRKWVDELIEKSAKE
jgi:hypothetical protein